MGNTLQSLGAYLDSTLGVVVSPRKWDEQRSLPVFMQSLYCCYTIRLLDVECLLLIASTEQGLTPSAIRKHFDIASAVWGGPAILVRRAIRPNERQRLISYKIPFVVPGNQLYLPDVGLDLREHFRSIRKEANSFSPATQVILLHTLLNGVYEAIAASELTGLLPYTSMTVKRAFDEMEQFGIASSSRMGRSRHLVFQTRGRELWDAALPFLQSPVQRRTYATRISDAMPRLMAGLSALSRLSAISPPAAPTFAVSADAWRGEVAKRLIVETEYAEEDSRELEIWRYDPRVLSGGDTVDCLSLYLSLRDTNDERIEAALNEMMESIQWYEA